MNEISNKRNYMLTLFSKFGGVIIQLIIGVISVNISLNYWGNEKFAILAVVNSIISYLSISNLGIGSATATLMGKSENYEDKLLILKRSFYILLILTVIFMLIFIGINLFYKDWIVFLGKIPSSLKSEAYLACYMLVIFYLINQPITILSTVFFAFQKQYVYDNFELVLKLTAILRLVVIVVFKLNMVQYIVFVGILEFVFYSIRALYGYITIIKKQKIQIFKITKSSNKETESKFILITGLHFFIAGMAAMISWSSDNLVISNFMGVEYVTPYSITYRLFSMMFMIIGVINMSLLPIAIRKFSEKNWEWINEKYELFSIITTISSGLFWLGGVCFFREIIVLLWIGQQGYAGFLVVFFLGGYSYILSLVGLNSGMINSFNYIKGTHWIFWFEAILNVGMSIVLSKYLGLGGIAIGTFLGGLFGPLLLLPIVIKRRSANNFKTNSRKILNNFLTVLFPMLVLSTLNYFFIEALYLRMIIGTIICLIYVLLSYNFSGEMLKNEIKKIIFGIKNYKKNVRMEK